MVMIVPGLRELNALAPSGFSGMAEVLEFLASLPTPEAIVTLRPSESLQAQISTMLEKNRTVGLTAAEEQQWQGYQYPEHIVRMASAAGGCVKRSYPEGNRLG